MSTLGFSSTGLPRWVPLLFCAVHSARCPFCRLLKPLQLSIDAQSRVPVMCAPLYWRSHGDVLGSLLRVREGVCSMSLQSSLPTFLCVLSYPFFLVRAALV